MFHETELNNEPYNDCYFSYDDGFAESVYVFIDGNNLVERISRQTFMTIAETGFGTGLNLIALIATLRTAKISSRRIRFFSVEKYPLTSDRIRELTARFEDQIIREREAFLSVWEQTVPLKNGWNRVDFSVDSIEVELNLYFGDVIPYLDSLPIVPEAWFLDGHSPDKNPDMWNTMVFEKIGQKSGMGTTAATFSAAGIVKEGLRVNGFFVKRRKGFGGKRHMTQAWFGESFESDPPQKS